MDTGNIGIEHSRTHRDRIRHEESGRKKSRKGRRKTSLKEMLEKVSEAEERECLREKNGRCRAKEISEMTEDF